MPTMSGSVPPLVPAPAPSTVVSSSFSTSPSTSPSPRDSALHFHPARVSTEPRLGLGPGPGSPNEAAPSKHNPAHSQPLPPSSPRYSPDSASHVSLHIEPESPTPAPSPERNSHSPAMDENEGQPQPQPQPQPQAQPQPLSAESAASTDVSAKTEAEAFAVAIQLDASNLLLRAGHMADDVQHETQQLHKIQLTPSPDHAQGVGVGALTPAAPAGPVAGVSSSVVSAPPPPPPPHHHHHHHGLLSWFFTYCWRSPKSRMPVGPLYTREYQHSKWKYRYYRYVNPWIRWLLILPILYLYTVSSAELTYRGDVWEEQVLNCTMQLTVTHPQVIFPNRRPFILRDLMFDVLPAATGDTLNSWDVFVNFSPAFFSVLMGIAFIIRWDVIRLTEYLAIQMWMFAWNGLIHVVTSVPDAGNNQDSCLNQKYHTEGDYIWWMVTFSYCNDMMWSGHTANTLLPLIMIRRLLWDMVGWNFSLRAPPASSRSRSPGYDLSSATPQFEQHKHKHQHELIRQYSHADSYHGAKAFLQYLVAANARGSGEPVLDLDLDLDQDRHRRKKPAEDEDEDEDERDWEREREQDPPQEPPLDPHLDLDTERTWDGHEHGHGAETRRSSWSLSHAQPAGEQTQRLDPQHQRPANKQPQTQQRQGQRRTPAVHANVDQDWFFHVKSSPFVTSGHVARHRWVYGSVMWAVRVIFPIWFCLLCIGILITRYHYTMDVVVAILVTLLTTSATQLLQPMVRWLYRPYYHNYLHREWWKPCYLTYPLNQEQINYEERVRRVGVGGYF